MNAIEPGDIVSFLQMTAPHLATALTHERLELIRRIAELQRHNAIDTKAIAWSAATASYEHDHALQLAESWLADFGLGLLPDSSSQPDAWASLGDGKFAFRFDSMGKSVIAFVDIDYDGAPDGHDTCRRVEVVRG